MHIWHVFIRATIVCVLITTKHMILPYVCLCLARTCPMERFALWLMFFVRGNLWLIQITFLWRENYIFRVENILYWRHIYAIISFLSPCVQLLLLPTFYLASIVSKDALPQLVWCYVHKWFHNHNKANLRYMFHNILSVSADYFLLCSATTGKDKCNGYIWQK